MLLKASFLPHVFLICVVFLLTVLALTTSNAAHPVFQTPSNDNFANAQPILGSSGIIHGTTVGATKEPGEPNHAGAPGGSSVWYKWQAPDNGRFVFSTFNSDFDTVIAVYTGQPLANNHVASNDNEQSLLCSINSRVSRVAFNAIGGTVYFIAIDSTDGFRNDGNIVLRWGRSATIKGRFTSASGEFGAPAPSIIRLEGDTCRIASPGFLEFTDVPTGHRYSIALEGGDFFHEPWPKNKSISPLTGDVLDLRFYVSSPVGDVTGVVELSFGVFLSGVTVTCSSSPPANATRTVTTNSSGVFTCSALPVLGNYLVTPSKQDFLFSPSSAIVELKSSAGVAVPTFTASEARTISGRVTNGTSGVSGVSISLSGSQTRATATDTKGNYSFVVPHGGNYTVTPSNANFVFTPENGSFSNLTTNQTANFTAGFLLQLILDDMGQVGALDSVLLMRDPFPVKNPANLLNTVDQNTRVAIFLSNFQLGPGELPSSVVINLVGSNGLNLDVPAEDVRPLADGLTRVTFKLPDGLTAGTCTLLVKARGLTSNMSAMRIK